MEAPQDLVVRELRISNVKRVVAVTIRPDGDLVVLGGKNGDGKSSTLDALMYALAGERAVCREPLRRGTERGSVDVDLGDFKIRRTFTKAGGGSITVSTRDGAKYPKPQALLDGLTSRISFDPLEFAGQQIDKQAETLRAVIGLDLREHDAERARKYAERTTANKAVREETIKVAALPVFEGVPDEEVSTAGILAERDAVDARNRASAEAARVAREVRSGLAQIAADDEHEMEHARGLLETFERNVSDAEAEVERWTRALTERRARAATQRTEIERLVGVATESRAKVSAAVVPEPTGEPTSHFAARLQAVETTNRAVRANAARKAAAEALAVKVAAATALDLAIEALDKKRAETIAAAKMPVPGLGFDPAGFVTLNGLPLEQASDAERIRVSVGIGLAMHPKLKMLMIRNASLLDSDGMALVRQMAHDAGAQFWLERVGRDAETTVEIIDGSFGESPSDDEAATNEGKV